MPISEKFSATRLCGRELGGLRPRLLLADASLIDIEGQVMPGRVIRVRSSIKRNFDPDVFSGFGEGPTGAMEQS
ncbi:hypothetical protein CBM2598_U10003 [Cupriavidus taiwanensis]|nr:hypothetical protein CBM2598_U10003 [Cupriavidus taiwanensis]